NKVQEDFKETLVKKIDAFADQLIGRNVVLELFSLDIDPSMCFSSSWLIGYFGFQMFMQIAYL
ncbi:hypothetical protein Tco_1207854, partial [Tanacetum coccineum]